MSFSCLALLAWSILWHPCPAPAAAGAVANNLGSAVTFHASFDHGWDADFARGDRRLFHAPSLKKPRVGTPGAPAGEVLSLANGAGRHGSALRFHRKSAEVAFYQAQNNVAYATSNWNGTVSFWLKLDPDLDLEPGFCDPLQITPRDWNDAALWVDFSKDDKPRHFRLGAFADRGVWDPRGLDLDKTPEPERPMVTVKKPPFTRQRWTHVAITLSRFNTGRTDGVATLYLDGQAQGAVKAREQTFTWNPSQTLMMLGIGYTGLFDELTIFNRALGADEVHQLFALPHGVTPLLK